MKLREIFGRKKIYKGVYYHLVASAEAALPGTECRKDETGAEDFFYQFRLREACVVGFSDSAEIDEDYFFKKSGEYAVIYNDRPPSKIAIPAKHFTKQAPIYERYISDIKVARRYRDLANEHERKLMEKYNAEHGTALKFR